MSLILPQEKNKAIAVLLDTGASNDFISQATLEEFNKEGIDSSASRLVCSGLGDCKRSLGKVKLRLNFINEIFLHNSFENKGEICAVSPCDMGAPGNLGKAQGAGVLCFLICSLFFVQKNFYNLINV